MKSVDVSYDLKCEDAPSHYGHGYGKDQSKVTMILTITMITKKLIMISLAHSSTQLTVSSCCQFALGVLQQTKTLPLNLKHHVGDPGQCHTNIFFPSSVQVCFKKTSAVVMSFISLASKIIFFYLDCMFNSSL